MAYTESLKNYDKFQSCRIGVNFTCSLCSSTLEPHNHLFFNFLFLWKLLKDLFPYGDFFQVEPTLYQVLHRVYLLDHKMIKHLYLLIISSLVYFIWKGRNLRVFSNTFNSFFLIKSKIKSLVAH